MRKISEEGSGRMPNLSRDSGSFEPYGKRKSRGNTGVDSCVSFGFLI
jgi:hypothetical protein